MKLIIVACALVAVAVAAPPPSSLAEAVEETVRSAFEQKPEGGYNFEYETDKGTLREEIGEVKEALDEENKPHLVVVVRGSYTYTDPDGNIQSVVYKADENGYEATGDGIPKNPTRR